VVVSSGLGTTGETPDLLPPQADVKEIAMVLGISWLVVLVLARGVIFWVMRESHRLVEQLHDRINLLGSDLDDARQHVKMLEGRLKIKDDEEQRERRLMRSTSIMDTGTGLYNEAYFHDILPNEINRAKRDKKQLVLTLIEVGGLEEFRAKAGEVRAKEFIAHVAAEIKRCAKRAGDFSFHFDDDHFGVLYSGLSMENTKRFVDFINEHLGTAAEGFGISADEARFTLASLLGFGDSMPDGPTYYALGLELLDLSLSKGEKIAYREL